MLDILSRYGDSIVNRIKQNLAATGTNATGKTSNSVTFFVETSPTKQALKILGRPYFFSVETGRKATPQYTQPSKEFVASIQEWMNAKGIPGQAYGIAKSIHQKGTKLFQSGGRTDVVSNVVNQGLVDEISQSVLERYATEFLKNAVNIFSSANTSVSASRA